MQLERVEVLGTLPQPNSSGLVIQGISVAPVNLCSCEMEAELFSKNLQPASSRVPG